MKLTGENRSTRGKTCPSATLSTTNPTWTDPGSNPGPRGGNLVLPGVKCSSACAGLQTVLVLKIVNCGTKLGEFLQRLKKYFCDLLYAEGEEPSD